jgi:hypothetical protein
LSTPSLRANAARSGTPPSNGESTQVRPGHDLPL